MAFDVDDLEVMLNAFPEKLKNDVRQVYDLLRYKKISVHSTYEEVVLDGSTIRIPARMYYNELNDIDIATLSPIAYRIMCAYFTRHNNGYIREKYLKCMLKNKVLHSWEMPYILLLLGEYVVEIIELVYTNWDDFINSGFEDFALSNHKLIMRTEGRLASYWGEYYRSYASKKEYVGFKIQKYLKSLRKRQQG